MVQLFMEGNIEEAINLQLKSIPLIKALFSEVNPIPVKEALNIIGYDYGVPRLPLVKMSDSASQKLKEEIYKIKK
jgi:4-hydroxy-tetrahydrodipicolinate synthase